MSQKVNDEYPEKMGLTTPMSDKELKDLAIAKHAAKESENPEVKVHNFPTEIIELPSKGKLYPDGHPLKNGTIEMKYMTAKEEDILTNQSFIRQGVVLDKLFKSLIVTDVQYHEILTCDKNAIMIAARVLGYGKDYTFKVQNPTTLEQQEVSVDLTQLKENTIDWNIIEDGKNEFVFQLPTSKRQVTLALMTNGKQKRMDAELKGLKKLKKNASLTTLLKYVIVGLDGDADNNKIRQFVDNELLAIDSMAIRKYLRSITPEIEMKIEVPDGESGDTFQVPVSIGLDFFWPDSGV